jgi:hypothetical protein
MYFNLIGCITVIVVGTVVSLLTQPKVPETVSDKVVLPFSIFIPPFLKGKLPSCTGDSESPDPKELQVMINGTDRDRNA